MHRAGRPVSRVSLASFPSASCSVEARPLHRETIDHALLELTQNVRLRDHRFDAEFGG